ncbi:MAG: hypothetical protein CVV64_08595 [Candidatus Wallbacteria bacterium HGW-Wallbacteria-1]|jgi:prepilin-type N-terminal cleavage/methylation domain-containing protein|uniref:Prepilin-type N-terminal cleavage/methylation domain-containing protein n=1 Tax=Candidatus Wallbacteria bacterium HGW-Wallbacteria-1 TaxID=2013854 RepID=A0A2N1PPZ1_9BACT|nr:MAG: hypothetical protein CVV64_08595 [Candidatus Wallbacteria bacterium HGW-Wallbacteria-1]
MHLQFSSPSGRAFTLIEVLISLAIVSAALFPVISSFRGAVSQGKVTQAYGMAVDILESRLTSLKNASFRSLSETFFPEMDTLVPGSAQEEIIHLAPEDLVQNFPGVKISEKSTATRKGPAVDDIVSVLDLRQINRGRAVFDFRLKARKFYPSYKYWGAEGKKGSFTGPSTVKSGRPVILFELEVFWKSSGEHGREGRVQACFLRSPTS